MRNLYQILEIPTTAGQTEIKRAFRILSKKYHPDLNQENPKAESLFIEIQQAYEILSHPQKKVLYDSNILYSKSKIYTPPQDYIPKVIHFYTDKTVIDNKEMITVFWKVENADEVLIRPLGNFDSVGEYSFKFNQFRRDKISLVLVATNNSSGKNIRSRIVLKHKHQGFFGAYLRASLYGKIKIIFRVGVTLFILILMIYTLFQSERKRQEKLKEEKERIEKYQQQQRQDLEETIIIEKELNKKKN